MRPPSASSAATIVSVGLVMALWCPADRVYRPSAALLEQAPGQFAEFGGTRTHYMLRGEGPLVVFVHGLGMSGECFNDIVPYVVGKGHKVLTYDIYGRGYSDGVSENQDLEKVVSQLAQLLLYLSEETGGLTTQPFALVGYSMGGGIASGFAARFPHLVRSLVMMAPAGAAIPIPLDAQFATLPLVGEAVFNIIGLQVSKSHIPNGHFDAEGSAHYADRTAAYVQRTHEYLDRMWEHHPGYIGALISTLRHFPLNGMEGEWGDINNNTEIPVTVIWGDSDRVCPFKQSSERLLQILPRAKLHVVKDAGHDDLVEKDAVKVGELIASAVMQPLSLIK